jgi:hypothetical protein
LRYYIDAGSDLLFPRVGIGYGWITNYHSDAIGHLNYEQTVYGLSLHLGVQFYTPEGFVFNFDLGMGSRYTITQVDMHPHFYEFYIRPNIGIGYDLTKLITGRNKVERIRNQEINPFQP